MTRYVDHVADAWCTWWSGADGGAAVVYARTATWWDARRGRGTEVTGRPALELERAGLHATIADLELEVASIVADDAHAVAEFVVTARETKSHVVAPGCAFWTLDDDGRIAREQWFWTWDDRGPDGTRRDGPRFDAWGDPDRDPSWYPDFVGRLVRAWDASPADAIDEFYASDAALHRMGLGGDGTRHGAEVLRATEERFAARLVERRSTVGEVVGQGARIACSHLTVVRGDDGSRSTAPFARVLTLDHHDRIRAEDRYVLRPWRRS